MQGSVIYQEIKRQGTIEGKIEGKIEGRREEALSLLLKVINQYLGELDPDLLAKIETLSLERMEDLAVALFNFDCLRDLELWLEDNI